MGATQCCDGRIKKVNGRFPVEANLKPERKASARISVAASNAYTDSRGGSIGYHSVGDDAQKFDEAFDNKDLPGFVSLLASRQPIDSFEDRLHPWADDPKTIGTLACTQLAILAAAAEKENANIKNEIREAGAIPQLIEFLRSSETDRVQAAMVSLSFLTTENPSNAVATYEAGAMPLIVKHMESDIVGMRGASATVLRDMYTERREFMDAFVALDGIKGLVSHLARPVDEAAAEVQLEAVLNLQDLIENPNAMSPQMDEALAREVIKCGAKEPLQKFRQSDDTDLRASAEELLDMLDGVQAANPAEPSS